MFGVDEAGRGPVLGSLFIGAVSVADDTDLPDGLKDSKRLSHARITELAALLRETDGVETTVIEVPREDIDDPDRTMTDLTVTAFAQAIDTLATDEESGVLDACHTDADTFTDLVLDEVTTTVDATSEHGADDMYPVVSAASIIAKDARERHVETLADEYGDIGSGYPSDPNTRAFLSEYVEQHGSLPGCARRSWKTSQDLLEDAEQAGLAEF